MRSRVLIAKIWLFEIYGACSLLVLTWMYQLETLLIVLHENQSEDTLLQGSPEPFSPSVKGEALGSRLLLANLAADYTIIMSRARKVTDNHVMHDRSAWFLRVIMSSSRALCCLPSVRKQKHDFQVCFLQLDWILMLRKFFVNWITSRRFVYFYTFRHKL